MGVCRECGTYAEGRRTRCDFHYREYRNAQNDKYREKVKLQGCVIKFQGTDTKCAVPGCNNRFVPSVHNQKYCMPLDQHPNVKKIRYDVRKPTGICSRDGCDKPTYDHAIYCTKECYHLVRSQNKKSDKRRPRNDSNDPYYLLENVESTQRDLDLIEAIGRANDRPGYNPHRPTKYIQEELAKILQERRDRQNER